ncbi:MAG: MBL fold metallo-hydrolase, partial [Thermoplasmata archaeon]|nr:MBL fold metallo-hydrolase [Thermoplasmata archaeon]
AEPLEADVLVMESTYAGREHPDRTVTEETLRKRIQAVIERGGTAIVPAFAVGRAQEVLLALADAGHEIFLDGMARKVNQIYLSAPEYMRDAARLRRAIENTNIVESPEDRKRALRDGEVIVTTGGMLDGGPVLYYLSELYRDPRHGIFLTGFQVEGSNGRQLVEHGTLTIDEVTVRPECEVAAFDFSSHAGHNELVDMVKRVKAKTVVLMHGDHREELAKALQPEHEVLMPQTGERFTV